MKIVSANSRTLLRFSDLEGECFSATLENPDYNGTVRVWAYTDVPVLVGLFGSLARDWRGWSDERAWVSIEGEFAVTFTHDKLGHITLEVAMHHDFGALEQWRLRASLVVDASQLDGIASDAKKFFNT